MERPDREGRRQAEFRGWASDSGNVYQARGSQYISYVHLHGDDGASAGALAQAGMRGEALERTQERVDLLIRALNLTQAEWKARCAELEAEVARARAEGRAEALAEVQGQLRAAELRVMQAQRMMREAVRERERTEALLTQAQQELALRRRAEERQEEEGARTHDAPSSTARLNEEGEQFAEFLERAEAELGAVRDDLRLLGEGMSGPGAGEPAQVIEGELAGHEATATPSREAPASAEPLGRKSAPGPPRRFLIALTWGLFAIAPCWLMLVVTSNRAAHASDEAFWQKVLFTVLTVPAGGLAYLLTVLLAFKMDEDVLDRQSERIDGPIGCGIIGLGTLALPLAAFRTRLTWPGPAGEWGQGLASAVGLG